MKSFKIIKSILIIGLCFSFLVSCSKDTSKTEFSLKNESSLEYEDAQRFEELENLEALKNQNSESRFESDLENDDSDYDYLPEKKSYIKWMSFDIPTEALVKAMNLDIRSYGTDNHLDWIEMLSYLASKYGGNWKSYKGNDLDALVKKLNSGTKMSELSEKMPNYNYFYKIYDAVLHNYLDVYKMPDKEDPSKLCDKYGLAVYSPIAKNYGYSHYDDFGSSRSFGFARNHLGNDLMGNVGTPIVAVESGVVESIGWNRYGGWRIGIRSFDKKRYYYYAHLRKGHPYVENLKQGMLVKQGEVIGYLGMTGYSNTENTNGMQKPHLHFGIQIIFDESQKDGNNEIWINAYNIVNLLSYHRGEVAKDKYSNDYYGVIY